MSSYSGLMEWSLPMDINSIKLKINIFVSRESDQLIQSLVITRLTCVMAQSSVLAIHDLIKPNELFRVGDLFCIEFQYFTHLRLALFSVLIIDLRKPFYWL